MPSKNYLTYTRLIFAFGLGSFLLMFLPILRFDTVTLQGYELILGKTLIDIQPFGLDSVASASVPFSLTALLAFTLPLIGGLLTRASGRLVMVSLACFLVSLFLLWSLPDQIRVAYTLFGNERNLSVNWIRLAGLYGAIGTTMAGAVTSLVLAMKS